jgi:mono/diheme cytochrome c family protein
MQHFAYAQPKGDATRGALLYATHCNACHSSNIHWREKKLVTDLDSLKTQVRHWQNSIKLDWAEEEIEDVVRYLNALYYHFPETDRNGLQEGRKVFQSSNRSGD